MGFVSENTRTSIAALFISDIIVSRSTMSGCITDFSEMFGSANTACPFAFRPIFAPLSSPSASSSATIGGNQWA